MGEGEGYMEDGGMSEGRDGSSGNFGGEKDEGDGDGMGAQKEREGARSATANTGRDCIQTQLPTRFS